MEGLRSQIVSGHGQGGLSRRLTLTLQQEAGYQEECKCCQHMLPQSAISISRSFYGCGLCPGLTGVWGLDHETTKGELL